MKTRKTIWLLVLTAVLFLVLPLSAHSEQSGDIGEDGGAWSFVGGTLTISGPANLEDFWPEGLDCYEHITEVKFGPEVTNIEANKFSDCPVQSFWVDPDNLEYRSVDGVLYNKAATQLLGVPKAKTGTLNISRWVTDVNIRAFQYCAINAFSVETGNQYFSSENGVLYNADKTSLILYPAGKTDTRFTLPAGVIQIDNGAFFGARNLREITLFAMENGEPAESLTEINEEAFSECSLGTVHFPSTLTRIGDYAFSGCTHLRNLTFKGTAADWLTIEIGRGNAPLYQYPVACRNDETVYPRPESGSIGEDDEVTFTLNHLTGVLTVKGAGSWGVVGEFSGDQSIRRVLLADGVTKVGDRAFHGCENLRSVTIPESVIRIGDMSFCGCDRLATVTIPVNVTYLGDNAFGECYALSEITYGGTIEQWNTLMDSREDEWLAWVTVHCSDGTIDAAYPFLRIEPIIITDCPETVSLGQDFTVQVQPQEHVYSYSATLKWRNCEIQGKGYEDGIISFWDWPDDATAGTYTLTIWAFMADSDYNAYGIETERTITVEAAERPAAPEIQIRVLKEGTEPAAYYTETNYSIELSWCENNVTAVRWMSSLRRMSNNDMWPVMENDHSASGRIDWWDFGDAKIYASICVNGIWSLWSEPVNLAVQDKRWLDQPGITMEGKEDSYEYDLDEDVVFTVALDPNATSFDYHVETEANDSDGYSGVTSSGKMIVTEDQQMTFTIDGELMDPGTYYLYVNCYADGFRGSESRITYTVEGTRPAGPEVKLDCTEVQFGDVLDARIYTDGAEEIMVKMPPYGELSTWLTEAGQETMVLPVKVEFYDSAKVCVRTRKNNVLSMWTEVEIQSCASEMDSSGYIEVGFPGEIIPGQDVLLDIPDYYGARSYSVYVYSGTNCLYWQDGVQPGEVTIPAVVFADGGTFSLQIFASDGMNSAWDHWEYEMVQPYTAGRTLSVAAPQQVVWPYGRKDAFTLTPGAGVSGGITTVFVQRQNVIQSHTGWMMDRIIADNKNSDQVWITPSGFGTQTYRFAACIGGEWTDWSEPVTITVAESEGALAPTDPVIPSVIEQGQNLEVSWSAVDHAQNYNVSLFSLERNEHHTYETGSTDTTYTIGTSLLRPGCYGVRIEACADGYESSTGRTRMISIVPGAFALTIDNNDNYPAGLPVAVGGFWPAGASGQEYFEVFLEQNGTNLLPDSYEPDQPDDQGRIVLVPRGLDAGEYTIRAIRHTPGEEEGEEATCTLTVTGERPTVGTFTVPETEVYILDEIQFQFSGDSYSREAYCIYTELQDGQPVDDPVETILGLEWDSIHSRRYFRTTWNEPMQQKYQFSLCCSDGRWTAWTDPVTVAWLSKGQAAAPTLTGMEGSELLAGEPLVFRGITLEENDGRPNDYDINLYRAAGDGDWEFVEGYSISGRDLNPDGSYTAELFGLDAEEDGSPRAYKLEAVHSRYGYVDSEERDYYFTVTGTRLQMPECVFPAGPIYLNDDVYAEISAEGITGACATYSGRYGTGPEIYLPEGGTVYVPLDTRTTHSMEYLFSARIGTRWTAPVEHEVTISRPAQTLDNPTAAVPETFCIGRPMEVTITPVANAEYYTVSVYRQGADGATKEEIHIDLVLETDADGKALIPTLDFVDEGIYVFAFSACADGYNPGTSVNYVATGSFAADAPPAPVTECLTAAPAPRQDVDFRITTDPEADRVSLLVYQIYEEYNHQELLISEFLAPTGGTADYTLNYWLVGQGDYRVRASQRVNGEWSAYSACDFTVAGEAAEQLPPVTITSFPEEIITGEPFTVSWEAVEGAASYAAEWRFKRDSVWTAVPLTGATSATMTIDPAAAGKEYYCQVRISAYAPGKVGSKAERGAEVLDSRVPTLAVSGNKAAPDDEVILTAGNVFGDRLRVSVDGGNPELVYSHPMNGEQTFSLRLDTIGEHTVRVAWGVSGKYTPIRPEYWSRWSEAATITVMNMTPHTVTFDANGGRGNMENQTVYEDTQLPLAANTFTRTGKYFTGWNTQADGRGTAYDDKQAVSLTEDTTLYAQWATKDIHFSVDVIDRTSGAHMIGGKVRLSGSYKVDDMEKPIYQNGEYCEGRANYGAEGDVALTLEAIPSAKYSFAGWYSGEVLDAYDQTLTPVEFLSANPILDLELTEHGWQNCTMICAVYAAYDTPAFRVPESLTIIEESAFENIGAATVYVPDTCTEIKTNAFKDCGQLRQIRLPKDCVIDDDANPFAGCRIDPAELEAGEDGSDLLTIFAPAGGTTQAWAEEAGIRFSAE